MKIYTARRNNNIIVHESHSLAKITRTALCNVNTKSLANPISELQQQDSIMNTTNSAPNTMVLVTSKHS